MIKQKVRKACFLSIMLISLLLCTSMVAAILPPIAPVANRLAYGYAGYGSAPVNAAATAGIGTYYEYSYPVRKGGFYGQNSRYLIGLRPGVYDGPIQSVMSRRIAGSQYYPRVGGRYFGYRPYYYASLRPGTFVFSGGNTGYAGPYVPYYGV